MAFIDRTLQLIDERGITKNKLLSDLNLSKNSFNNWSARGTIPSAEIVIKIAKYFKVSVDYLLGLSESRRAYVPFDKIETYTPNYDGEPVETAFSVEYADPEKLSEFENFLIKTATTLGIEIERVDKKNENNALSDNQKAVLAIAEQLPDEDVKKLIDYAELLAKAGKKE